MRNKTSDSSKQIILLMTDKDSPVIEQQYQVIQKSLKQNSEICLAFHCKDNPLPLFIEETKHFVFTNSILTNLGFKAIRDSLLPGSNHFPLLEFYRNNPDYDFYWVIEDDVRFNGDWSVLFDSLNEISSDFITCRIRDWKIDPTWYWWDLSHPFKKVPLDKRINSFNPIYRISNIALNFINMALLDGWIGHHEVLLPTLLKYGGYQIADFGGDGKYVLPGFENRFYYANKPFPADPTENATMRFRPPYDKPGNKPNKLYHPVKDFYIAKL
jgi:hypothetical protein